MQEEPLNPILNLINTYGVKRHTLVNDIDNEMYINQYVEHIYIINLEKDNIRRNYIIKLMQKYKINCELIIVPLLQQHEYEIIGNKHINISETGCYLSHMYCLNDAIRHNFKNIIIFEDDIILHKQFHLLFEKTIKKSDPFDILMLGASDFNFMTFSHSLVNKEKSIYKPHINSTNLKGSFSVYYSNKGYLEFFNKRLESPTYIDDQLIQCINSFSNSFYICYPNIVVPDLSTSNIQHNFWITNEIKETYYFKKCYHMFNFKEYNYICLVLLNNFTVNDNLTYEENMLISLNNYFIKNKDKQKIKTIKEKLEFIFFTIEDLKFMCNNLLI
jgi:GR25 family glycosyltransferase involved in LPS biosynthesis